MAMSQWFTNNNNLPIIVFLHQMFCFSVGLHRKIIPPPPQKKKKKISVTNNRIEYNNPLKIKKIIDTWKLGKENKWSDTHIVTCVVLLKRTTKDYTNKVF